LFGMSDPQHGVVAPALVTAERPGHMFWVRHRGGSVVVLVAEWFFYFFPFPFLCGWSLSFLSCFLSCFLSSFLFSCKMWHSLRLGRPAGRPSQWDHLPFLCRGCQRKLVTGAEYLQHCCSCIPDGALPRLQCAPHQRQWRALPL